MPAPVRQPINHGTPGGYVVHRGRGEKPCPACSEAHKANTAAWRSVLIICKDCGQERRRCSASRCSTCYGRFKRAKKGKASK